MLKLLISAEAKDDLDKVRAASQKAFYRLIAFFEQLRADPNLLDALTIHDYGADKDEAFHVSKFKSFWSARGRQQAGKDLWRLKLWDLEEKGLQYRVIYAYEIRRQRYHILGIIDRGAFNYEPDHPFTKRILAQYDDLCG